MFAQRSSPPSEAPGQVFAADVIKRSLQVIFAIRDTHSSFTVASIIPDERALTLQSALITSTTSLRAPVCSIRVDSAPGFNSLRDDQVLSSHGISLEFGRIKNINKNPVAEKCNQELEQELLRLDPTGGAISHITLQDAAHTLNSRIRNRGLSAREILFCRDQVTSEQLSISDNALSKSQQQHRDQNHTPSAKCKGNGAKPVVPSNIDVGSLVYIKKEGDKSKARESYIVMGIRKHLGILQKLNASGNFMPKSYEVPLVELIPAVEKQHTNPQHDTSSSSDDDEPLTPVGTGSVDNVSLGNTADNAADSAVNNATDNAAAPRRSERLRQEPTWLRDEVWERD